MPPTAPWSAQKKATFRFACALLLLAVPYPLGPFSRSLNGSWYKLWEWLVPLIAARLLHMPSPVRFFASAGDQPGRVIQLGSCVVLAFLVAIIWTLLDRHRRDYARAHEWLRLYVRLYLAWVLFGYGWSKILPHQFPPLGPDRLSENFGEASPHGLLWAFMGYSPGYSMFAGLGEALSGVLVCFRRTTTLGALLGVAVISNVVALNLAYDVSIKLSSILYLVMLVFLVVPDAHRLMNVLVLNRSVAPKRDIPLLVGPRRNYLVVTAAGLLAAYFFVTQWQASATDLDRRAAARSPLYGLYDVEVVARAGVVQPYLVTDSARWVQVAFGADRATIRFVSGTLGFFIADVDSVRHLVRFTSRDDPQMRYDLAYVRPDRAHLVLRGRLAADSINMWLRRRDETKYLLVDRPFHWVQNAPFNR